MRRNNQYSERLGKNSIHGRARARVAFKIHLMVYAAVMALLWVIAILTDTIHSHPWPVYPMLGWGIGLAGHYFAAFRKYDSWIEREIEKENGGYLTDNTDEADELVLKPLQREKIKPSKESDFI